MDKGCLLIRDGNTHFPAEQREWRFFKGGLDIPPSIVAIDGSGEVTLDAIDWLATQSVPLIRLRWNGEFASVVTSSGQAASSEKVLWQEQTRADKQRRLAFGLDLIQKKAQNTLATMENHMPRSRVWDRAYKNIEVRTTWLGKRPPQTVSKLLGTEGAIAGDYFRACLGVELKWRVSKRHPIPDDWHKYSSRSALRIGSPGNHGATHPINAMLNYAYGVLSTQTQIQLIADGYDPTIGILHDHKDRRGTYPAFVLDRIEPMRPVVDRAVLQLIASETFTGADFSIQNDGSCRLNPELARRVAQFATDASLDRNAS